MTELAKESWNYTLSINEAGDLLLNVVSGAVGLYEFTIQLTAEEAVQYKKRGNPYLAELANEIRTHESRFQARRIG